MDVAYRRVRRWLMVLGGLAIVLTLIPAIKDVSWSLLLGILLGGLNFHLLLSGLRRAMQLNPTTARGAFQVASFLRLALIGGLLYWAAKQGPQLMVWVILIGFFLPEILFFVELYGRTKEESL